MTTLRKIVLTASIVANMLPLAALATSSSDQQSVNDNTVFYDPNYTDPCAAGTGTITLTGKDVLEQAYTALASNLGLNAVQAAGIMGNLMWESGGGVTIRPNADQNLGTATYPTAGDGFGIAQWTPAAGQQPLVALAQKENVLPDTLAIQVQYLIDELKNNQEVPNIPDESQALTALKATNSVSDATQSFMTNFEAPSIPDFAQRLAGAQAVYAADGQDITGGGQPPATGPGAASTCTPGGPNTGIVGTALQFAWPQPSCTQTFRDANGNTETRTGCLDATQAYQKGWDQAGGDPPMTDCGAYVASVIIDSKADPNYPPAGTIGQYQYVKSHPALYKIINTQSTNGLEPGDILVASNEADGTGHTALYVGTNPGESGFVAAASWGGHTPQMEGDSSAGEVAFILAQGAPYGAAAARYIGTTAKAIGS